MITVFCVNMFGDALRDLLDPRLRGGQGRRCEGETQTRVPGSTDQPFQLVSAPKGVVLELKIGKMVLGLNCDV